MPAVPRSSPRARLFVLLALCSLLGACGGDDDGSDTPVGPDGPVDLSITGFLNNQDQDFDRDAGEVVLSCDGTINVLFGPRDGANLENWLLRPPGACESAKQCGYIVLELTSEAGGTPRKFAGANTSLLATLTPGRYQLDAVLYTGDGEPYLQEQLPVEDTLSGVEFTSAVDCALPTTTGGGGSGGSTSASGGSSGASTEGAGGAAGDAGAAGQAGAGGAAGAVQG